MPEVTTRPLQGIGNYDLLNKIAEGGMGAVYKGRHRESGQIVAIKIIPPATAKNPVLLQRFKTEYEAAKQLDHPNIVKAIEYDASGPNPFLVMEFVDGESLGNLIEREGPIPEDLAVRIIAQVCQGLHRAHKQKLIHRDVKPDNVMLTSDYTAKLTDLGLVKEVDGDLNLTKTGRGLGTPHFMAPEQFRNAKHADVRCDIYSIGATLYMMVTGEVPFGKVGPLDCWMKKIRNDFTPPRELKPDLSDRVDWAIRRAMSGDPDQRPATCREFVEDLTGLTIRAKAPQQAVNPNAQTIETPTTSNLPWYLVYKDDTGETHTVKGTTDGIRKALKEGLLGDAVNIRACQSKQGPFKYLKDHPEFRDLVISPAPMEQQKKNVDPNAAVGTAQMEIVPRDNMYESDAERVSMKRMPQPMLYPGNNTLPPQIPLTTPKKFDWAFWGIIGAVVIATLTTLVVFWPKK
ncbi:serine/threonine protein kinase [Telmatocola sphagniphila]|uniref:Serine/threonine protein kinase n=1 Tax=Telmatocola sphagniphila TaxID=1123043 RepID=A0A8E6ESN8_9BACT|nr:serine/threonine-protein kinase [Telmatocola sphagniphila]QVL31069.1 serine/threonine protein kinase [Telmatocola sphagniphila]